MKRMDSLTEKIIELEKLLGECYIAKRSTKTKDLAKVLPSYPALKKLKGAAKDLLELWDFYRSWQFRRKLERKWKKKDKIKAIKPKKAGYHYTIQEDLSLDEKRRHDICIE